MFVIFVLIIIFMIVQCAYYFGVFMGKKQGRREMDRKNWQRDMSDEEPMYKQTYKRHVGQADLHDDPNEYWGEP